MGAEPDADSSDAGAVPEPDSSDEGAVPGADSSDVVRAEDLDVASLDAAEEQDSWGASDAAKAVDASAMTDDDKPHNDDSVVTTDCPGRIVVHGFL